MSKSLGNGIDPLVMADQYGADALRFNLITGKTSPGNGKTRSSTPSGARPCATLPNKIWNASRFLMMNLTVETCELPEELELEDKWILSKLNSVIPEVTENMEKFELGVAAQKVYDFIWDDYCDWYIELTKARLQGEDEKARQGECPEGPVLCPHRDPQAPPPLHALHHRGDWQALPHKGDYLMLQQWPEHHVTLDFPEEEKAMELIMDAIRAVRTRRSEMNVPPPRRPTSPWPLWSGVFIAGIPFLKRMAYASDVTVTGMAGTGADGEEAAKGSVTVITHAARVSMPLAELVDLEKEKARVEKELEKNRKMLSGLEGKLQNPGFVNKAPANVVEAERERAEKLRALIEKLESQLQSL